MAKLADPKAKKLLEAARACYAAGVSFAEPLEKLNQQLNQPPRKGRKKS